ncbi:HD-GYP domain-containing protein [Deinococcus roseus]|uniref:HD-GYP domain-containing protein n=1 Tax=Deinococcus roseus TaxID=392414 RepID=A0ABQ2D992_9DEIO|nr:HD-GYP domain-containing protein [Deinococcus roseus]GGJ50446.1 hypothetical protein GCM10008938_40440 [Deinococcus roseus]
MLEFSELNSSFRFLPPMDFDGCTPWLTLMGFWNTEEVRHAEGVARWSVKIAGELGWSALQCEELRQAALLHDIGKMAIPQSIVFKPGQLTPEETRMLQQHTLFGMQVLGCVQNPVFAMAAQVAMTHHERFDGAGYPLGVSGKNIPLAGRIVAVADVFDALTRTRVYKEAWSVKDAIALIEAESGKQFDPEVVQAFLKATASESLLA